MAIGAAITDDQIQAFLNALPHASLLLDFQGTILGANEAAQHLFEDCAGRKLEELAIDAPSAERIRGFFTQSQLTQHLSATLTHQILNPQGERGRVAWTLKGLPGIADPRIIASAQQSVIQTAEISDDSMLDGESFRAAVEHSTNGLILLDHTLAIRYWNPAARRLFGYDIEEVLGQPVENLIKAEERARWAGVTEVLQSAPNDFAITHDVECLRSNGTAFTAELTFTVWFREAARNISLRVRDLTVAQHTDARLRQLSRAVENSPTSIVITDAEGLIEYVNPKFEELTGYTLEEARGQTLRSMSSGYMKREEYEALWQIIKSGQVWRGEFLNKRKNGELYWELASISPIFDERGRISNFVAVKEDISQRKALEQRLRQLSQAVENSPVAIVITDAQGLVDYVNPRFVELTGYSLEDVYGKLLRALRPGTLTEDELEALWQGLKAGQSWRGEFLNKRKGGSFYWEMASISPLLNEHGELMNLIAVREDISERKLMEQRLRLSEARYRSVVDSQSEMVWRFTPGFVITFVNETFCHYVNRRPEELLMNSVFDVLPADQHEQVRQFMARLTPEEPARENEIPVVTGHGEQRWHVWRDLALFDEDGRVVEYQSVGRDVTERKRVEEALRLANQRLEMHLKQTPLAVIEHDMDFRILRWNPAAEQIFGYSEAEVLGKEAWLLVSEDARPSLEALKEDIYSSGQPRKSINQNVCKDGRVITCEWYNTPLVNDDGEVVGAVSMAQDVTERERAAAALKESEANLTSAQEVARLGSWELPAGSPHGIWSQQMFRLFDLEPADQPPDFETYLSRIHPDDRAVVRDALDKMLAGEVPVGREYRSNPELLPLRWFYPTWQMERDADGKPVRFFGTLQDITERKQAEEALRLANQRLALHHEQTPLSVIEYDADFRIIGWNIAAKRIFGYSAEEAIGQMDLLLWPPDELDRAEQVRNDLRRERVRGPSVGRALRKDGHVILCEWYDTALIDTNDEIIGFASLALDITERKQAENALRLANQRLATHLENTPLAVVEFDVDFKIIGWNHAAEQIFGYSAEEAIGQDDYLLWLPERHAIADETHHRLLREGVPAVGTGETRRKDGQIVTCEWYSTPLTDESGQVIGVASLALDITERKQAEEALRQANQRLGLHITNTPLAVIEYDADFNIIGWNQAAEQIFGYSAEEAIGQTDLLVWAPGREELVDKVRATLRSRSNQKGEGPAYRKDGRLIHCEWYNTALVNEADEIIGFASLVLDVTERKQVEEALRKANQRLALHLEQTPMAVIEYDVDFNIIGWNQAAEQIFGYSAEEAIGQTDLLVWMPGMEHLAEITRNRLRTLRGSEDNSGPAYRKDGRLIHCDWFNTPLVNEADEIIGFASLALDITERKQAEEALRQANQRLALHLEQTPMAVIEFDADFNIIGWNQAAEQVFGYSAEEAIGQTDLLLWAPERAHLAEDERNKLRTQRGSKRGIGQGYHRDGRLIYLDWFNTALVNEADEIIGFASLVLDITERRQAEEALAESEARYRAIVEDQTEFVTRYDAQGQLTFANEALLKYLQRSQEDVEGLAFSEIIYAEDLPRVMESIASLTRENPVASVEQRIYRGDGVLRWHLWTHHALFDEAGHLTGYQGVGRDITEEKALSEAIRKSEANLRAILDHTGVAYLLFDLEGRLMMVNPAAKESARVFLNMELTEGVMVSELLSGDLQADFRRNFARALNDQSTRSEMYVDMPDGKQRWFELHYQPIRIEDGVMLGAFVSIDEITERRDAEKRRLALELEHRRVEIISHFVRDASHEFRNPLTMINTAAGLMSRSDDPARRAQKAQQVEAQIQRITRLLDDLLMMAELDGSPRMDLSAVDPNLVLRMLSLRIADRAKARQQTVTTALAQDLPLIVGDLQWLNEAVLRVADNSLRYCPEGATIRIESRRSGEEVVLSICDNGAGIPLETVPQIFDRFYRAGRSPTEAGFGLGLAIVRRIVDLHGGRAEVETHPGEGVCFRLIFPAADQNTPERRRN